MRRALAMLRKFRGESDIVKSLKSLDRKMENVEQKMGQMAQKMGQMEQKIGRLEKGFDRVEAKLDFTVENQVRNVIANMFGHEYARQYSATCIADLVDMLPKAVLEASKICEGVAPTLQTLKCSELVARHLLEEQVPEELLTAIIKNLVKEGLPEDLALSPGPAIGWCHKKGYESLAILLADLQKHLDLPEASRSENLFTCRGPGLMCLMFKAAKDLVMAEDQQMGVYKQLEFDMRGRIQCFILPDLVYASVDVAEVTSTLDYSSAVPHLALRTQVVKYILRLLLQDRNEKELKITCFGRMIVPRVFVASTSMNPAQQAKAAAMGYSLYLHVV